MSAPDLVSDLPCRQHDEEMWFSASPDRLEKAKALCRSCPLLDVCRTGALDRAEPWGVWGGEIFEDGVIVARKRRRGRPPRTERHVRRPVELVARATTARV